MARLSADALRPWCIAENVSRGTQRKRVSYARIFLGWCEGQGHVKENVAASLRMPKKDDAARTVVRKAVTLAELERIAAAAEANGEAWKSRVYRFAFFSGLRASELARMQWADVTLADGGGGTVTLRRQKNGRVSVLPLAKRAAAVLAETDADERTGYVFRSPRQRVEGRNVRVFASHLGIGFRVYLDRLGISRGVTFHGLRHGFATHLAEGGASAWVVKEACRHSSVNVSQVYVRLADRTLAAELDAAFE